MVVAEPVTDGKSGLNRTRVDDNPDEPAESATEQNAVNGQGDDIPDGRRSQHMDDGTRERSDGEDEQTSRDCNP